jgi:two-component system invasion response regulator UvrY
VLKQLRSDCIKTPVLILSIHPESQYALRTLQMGGNGFICKDCTIVEFIRAVKVIMEGKKYISQNVAEQMTLRLDKNSIKEDHELISNRELQVLKMIASGKMVSEIAKLLCLSVATISTYRSRLLGKMNLKNNAELTFYVINSLKQ